MSEIKHQVVNADDWRIHSAVIQVNAPSNPRNVELVVPIDRTTIEWTRTEGGWEQQPGPPAREHLIIPISEDMIREIARQYEIEVLCYEKWRAEIAEYRARFAELLED